MKELRNRLQGTALPSAKANSFGFDMSFIAWDFDDKQPFRVNDAPKARRLANASWLGYITLSGLKTTLTTLSSSQFRTTFASLASKLWSSRTK